MSHELPAGWTWTTLGDVVARPRPKTAPSMHPDLPFVGMESIAPGGMQLLSTGRFGEMKSAGGIFEHGDVLYGRMRPYLNKVHCARHRGACSAEFIVMPPSDAIDGGFLAYLLHHQKFVNFASEQSTGDRPRVDFDSLVSYKFCLPPLDEQRRIVSRIEELFSEIDEGERALDCVQKLVERYRQSVLKAAVTGELTRACRQRFDSTVNQPTRPDRIAGLIDLPDLPPSWAWIPMGDLLARIETGKSFKCDERPPSADEYGIVKVSAVTWGAYDELESKTITDPSRVDLRYEIRAGDFLFSRANTIQLVGACVIVDRVTKRLLLSDKILRLVFRDRIERWIDLVLKSPLGRAQIEALSTGNQQSMRNIGQDRIRSLMVPMPTERERTRIEDQVERQLQSMNAATALSVAELRKSFSLRQCILRAAFSGQLVPQDPSDEPASVLLARLAEHAATTPATPRRRTRSTRPAP